MLTKPLLKPPEHHGVHLPIIPIFDLGDLIGRLIFVPGDPKNLKRDLCPKAKPKKLAGELV
jgi:hypothetical protein